MRHLLSVISAVVVLAAVVAGCGDAHRYDARLAAADSLMRTDPDSALAIVGAVDRDSLADEGDRAYRDLLLTQARYRCYVTATSDSDINRALAYYRAHSGEQEKLTRAYIYKGAVMEELGHPDSAMLYYKTAEATAAPDDYFNLGQINTRIAVLYRIYFADIQICYEKYKKAFEYYKTANDSALLLNSLYNMGMCSGITGNGCALRELKAASTLAIELNDSSIYYKSQEMLVRQFIHKDSSINQAKQTALHLLNHYRNYLTRDLMMDLADIYIKTGMSDSAKHYVRLVNDESESNEGARIMVRKYGILADIAETEGDLATSYNYAGKCKSLSDSINNNTVQYNIQLIENKLDDEHESTIKNVISKQQWIAGSVLLAILLLVMILVIYHFRKLRIVKLIIRELKTENVNTHEALLKKLQARDSSIVKLVGNLVDFMRSSIEISEKDSPKVIKKRIQESICELADENFWKELRTYLDSNHDNIISNIAKNKKINEADLRFIELTCCGFSYVEMAIMLGYSPNFVSNKRIRITKKLGLKVPLQDYLDNAMNGENP